MVRKKMSKERLRLGSAWCVLAVLSLFGGTGKVSLAYAAGTIQINFRYWRFALAYSVPLIPHGISQVLLNQFDLPIFLFVQHILRKKTASFLILERLPYKYFSHRSIGSDK